MVGGTQVRMATEAVRRRLSLNPEDQPNYIPDLERCTSNGNAASLANAREKDESKYVPTDWDDSLPYGGKVYLARKKKKESLLCIALQILIVLGCGTLLYYGWYHTEYLHYHTTKLFANLGHKNAQSLLGHKYLHGKGVEKNHTEAMKWLYEAAKKGDPHAAYNVAIGHLQGLKTSLKPGEVKEMIQHAADNGVEEALIVLARTCSKGKCDV